VETPAVQHDADRQAALNEGRCCVERAGEIVGEDRNFQRHEARHVSALPGRGRLRCYCKHVNEEIDAGLQAVTTADKDREDSVSKTVRGDRAPRSVAATD